MNLTKSQLIVLAIVVGVVLGALIYASKQANNQIVPPNPYAQAAPVVPVLPDIIGYFRATKASSENGAIATKRQLSGGANSRQLLTGEQLYGVLHANHEKAVSYVETALARRFTTSDGPRILELIDAQGESVLAFATWQNRVLYGDGHTAAGDAGEGLFKAFIEWVTSDAANDEALKLIREDLKQCHMRAWSELNP